MSALNDLMQKDNNQTTDLEFSVIVLSEIRPEEAERAAAELAALRARLDELESDHSLLTKRLEAVIFDRDDYAQQLTQSKIERVRANERIAEQARQLEDARVIFENIFKRDWTNAKIHDKARAWLAANPAPQEPQP